MELERLVIDNIKRVRKEKGFSQEKLAEACDTSASYIGLMEIYRNVPKLSTIERIAYALDVDPLAFFQRTDPLPEEQEAAIRKEKQAFLAIIDKELDRLLRTMPG
ncbi:hypothetical protein FACS1894137_01710 [Spirochaetia bacterium]|nr:hypothetical protein FACS1894137_01710 [Spirochaetia bacterium]